MLFNQFKAVSGSIVMLCGYQNLHLEYKYSTI